MADRPDADSEAGANKPALRLHVPEPKFRPGDTVDFSHVPISEAGKQPRPDEACDARETEGLCYDLIRVLGDDDKAHGPGIRSSIPKRCARCWGISRSCGHSTSACSAASAVARPAST